MSSDHSTNPPVRTADVKRGYQRPSSFTDLLPWVEYIQASRAFLLEDGVSVGALFELEPVGTEARTEGFMIHLRDAIQTALTEAIPEIDDAPWVLQVYVQDEPSLTRFRREEVGFVDSELRGVQVLTPAMQVLTLMQQHRGLSSGLLGGGEALRPAGVIS